MGLNFVQVPLEETLTRTASALRTRNVLVTVEDYEAKTSELLGFGSRATAYPLLSSDKQTEITGNIHIFAVDAQGKPLSLENCSALAGQLKALSFAGSSVWVSPVELSQVDIEVIVRIPQLSSAIASRIYGKLADYLSPLQFPLGTKVRLKELEYLVRSGKDVLEVVSMLVNGQAVNLPMPNKYTTPELSNVTLTLLDDLGRSHTYYLGVTEGDMDA